MTYREPTEFVHECDNLDNDRCAKPIVLFLYVDLWSLISNINRLYIYNIHGRIEEGPCPPLKTASYFTKDITISD